MLIVLEASHWHARSFNEDTRLRSKLKEISFMVFKHVPNRCDCFVCMQQTNLCVCACVCAVMCAYTHPKSHPHTHFYTQISQSIGAGSTKRHPNLEDGRNIDGDFLSNFNFERCYYCYRCCRSRHGGHRKVHQTVSKMVFNLCTNCFTTSYRFGRHIGHRYTRCC